MKTTILPLKPRLASVIKRGDRIMATAPASQYPAGRPRQKVIKVNKVNSKQLQRLIELGYTVVVSHG